ncbi:MAG: hypothetical protein AB1641_13510 [Thermodesulfobacteriota bacterium]
MNDREYNWKALQKHLGYSDQEMETFKSDPKRNAAARKLFHPDILKKDLVVEVVEAHGCGAGLKPGDKLVFHGLALLDMGQSSQKWCAHALGQIPGLATLVQDRYVSGLDPNGMIYDHFSCGDVGPMRHGWGQVVMKAYVQEAAGL